MSNNEEKDFRLRPRKPPLPKQQNESRAWSIAFQRILHYSRMSRRGAGTTAGAKMARRPTVSVRFQRCAVRVIYTRNATRGQWRAHGRYLARHSANSEVDAAGAGFDPTGHGIDIAKRLGGWQASRDRLFWKLILSPEFGDRVDLERLTHDVMNKMETDLGTKLEWVAVAHYNTEHPHIHVALRGVRDDGRPLEMERSYIREGIRAVAEDFCTRQLGYRTELDAREAERREVYEKRFTSLDRLISRRGMDTGDQTWFPVLASASAGSLREAACVQGRHVAARVAVLAHMGLAVAEGPDCWYVRRDFESILRAMQRTVDRQKMLAAHGVLLSDERLPIELLNSQRKTTIEGRVLVHDEDEASGRSYLMLEGTDAKLHLVYYTPEIEEARSRGSLGTNSFVRLRNRYINGRVALEVSHLGDAESILTNRTYLDRAAQRFMNRGIVPLEDGWGGWLGRYQAVLRQSTLRLHSQRQCEHTDRSPDRAFGRDRSPGR